MPSNVKLLAGASGGEPTDANFKNVTLLLHGDGSNGAQNNTFIDSSSNNFTITRNGNTTQGSFSPYGSNWSNYFDGSGDYLQMPSNAAFAFGTGDYTIEGWFYPTLSGADQRIVWFSDDRHNVDVNASNGIQFYDGSVRTFGSVNINSWNHFAVSRSGGTVSCYLNGVRGYNASETTNSTTRSMNVAANNSALQPFNGYISNIRVLKGTGLYSGSTITVPTAPLTAITNTSLLTCAYNRFRDGSTNNFTITRNGDVKVTNFSPFAPSSSYSTSANGGSAFFDGTGDYLTAPDNTAFDFGSGNFTIEMWVYRNNATNPYALFAKRNSSDSETKWVSSYINTNGTIQVQLSTNGSSWAFNSATTSAAATTGWTHLAFVRNGSDFSVYVDGAKNTISSSLSGSVFTDTNPVAIGQLGLSGSFLYPMNGYISNFRIVKGTAVYTAAFTPTTTPLTAISGTSLLTNFTNAAIFDNSMKNDLETVGNAQISTSVKKFGTGSMAFVNAAGDRVFAPSSTELALGSGNFTLECWVYPTAFTTNYAALFDFRSGPNFQATAPLIYLDTSGKVWWNDTISSSGTLSLNTWSHVAFVRNSGTITIYINGTSAGSASNTNTFVCNLFNIGATNDLPTTYYLRGYMDDIRLTKGVARYTANFTAPTAPFPNK